MVDWIKLIKGFLLSFVFVLFFAYMVSGVKWLSDNSFNKSMALGSIRNAVVLTNQQQTNNTEGLDIQAQSAISIWTNLSGSNKILFNKDVDKKLSIASITKLMTALVVVENLDLSQEIKIGDKAVSQNNNTGALKVGETFFARDLLYASLIGSDNTASYALLEAIGEDKFIRLMNEKAKELQLLNTSFLNPTGLDLENFSTVGDLTKLAEYLLKNHISIFEITAMSEFNFHTSNQETLHIITSTDILLKDPSISNRVVGGKTGKTRSAGECLLLVVKPADNNQGYLINVILNSNDRFGEMKKIINWADKTYRQ